MTPQQAYRELPLTKGYVALVDESDFAFISQWKWRIRKFKASRTVYAVRCGSDKPVKAREMVLMHRQLMGLKRKDGKIVDHKNGNGLDNRRENLRLASPFQSSCNSIRVNSLGFRGVKRQPTTGKFRASIQFHGKCISLGDHPTPEAAHEAYCAAAKLYHGEFARFDIRAAFAPAQEPEA